MPDPVDTLAVSDLPLEDLVACHECDLLMRKPTLARGEKAQCPRCGYELYAHRHNVVERSLALVLAALLLYVPANFLPIMELNLLGQSSQDTVWSGVLGLFDTGMQGVAAVVFLCSMGIPLLKLLCQLAVLLSIHWNIGRSYGLLLYRIYHHLRDWRAGRHRKAVGHGLHQRRFGLGLFYQSIDGSGSAGGGDVASPDMGSVVRRGCSCERLMRAF